MGPRERPLRTLPEENPWNQGVGVDDKFMEEVTDGNGGSDQATFLIIVLDVEYVADSQPIFDSSCCRECHINQTTNGVRLCSKDTVLDSRGDQYGGPIVEPGDASRATSPLVDKILSGPGVGARMPLTEEPRTDEQIRDICAWTDHFEPET